MVSKINIGLNLKDYLLGGPLEGKEPLLIFFKFYDDGGPMPWLRWVVAGLSLYMPGFSPMLVHVGFVVNRVAQGQVFFPCQYRAHFYLSIPSVT